MFGAITSRFPQALGRLAAALVLAVGLLSAAGAAQAMNGGFHGGGSQGGGFHGGVPHGGFHGEFHDGHFHHHHFHNRFFFGGFGGCCGDPFWGGYYPYYPYNYPYYDPPPAGVTQDQPNCQSGQWRLQDGSVVSGTACLQPDGTWRMAY